jgi:hypothetical protein
MAQYADARTLTYWVLTDEGMAERDRPGRG